MREWFRDWFNEDYAIVYMHRDDREAESFTSIWPIWKEQIPAPWCLDLGCGNGRFTRAIAVRGLRVVGLDLSRFLLQNARARVSVGNASFYLLADLRSPPVKPRFGLAVSLFTSFGYFNNDEEHRQVLQSVRNLLVPGGFLVLDLPNAAAAARDSGSSRQRLVKDCRITESWRLTDDRKRIEKNILLEDQTGRRRYRESIRLFTEMELLELTNAAGFEPMFPLWGDYSQRPLAPCSSRMVYFGRRRG